MIWNTLWSSVQACRLAAIAVILVAWIPGADAATEPAPVPTVLITGANRGIGLEFTRQYAARGWQVIATTRRPEEARELQSLGARHPNVTVERLDITDGAQVSDLGGRYRGRPVDFLINNAALLEGPDRQLLGRVDYELFTRTVAVNAMGPLRVTEAFLENVAASRRKTIVILSSAAASHGLLGPPINYYPYRASKAALNMVGHELALELKERGIRVAVVNPGLVDTRGIMALKPGDPVPEEFVPVMPLIRSGALKLITPEESVRAMTALFDRLTWEQTGVFLNYDGKVLPW
jgi:NAD(P)-dependent dehydrogenase (short-subunit alcohol dehydrogenase family)